MTNDTSGESRQLVLKALAEDEGCQHQDRLANEPNNLPEPPKPPNNPAQRQTKSPSIELEGERRAASSCNVECTRTQTDASEAPGHDGDDEKWPMKLLNMSVRVSKQSK